MTLTEDIDKLRGMVSRAMVGGVKCPKCETPLAAKVVVPDDQRMRLCLDFEGEMPSAATIGGCITNMRKILKLAAKDCGYRVEVFVSAMEMKPGKVLIEFAIVKQQLME